MFNQFDTLHKGYDWNALIDFGLKEHVVTRQTAYIVLERIEDYIKFNIEAPEDLKQECEKRLYVRQDTRSQRYLQQQQNELFRLNTTVNYYNNRIRWYDNTAPLIQLSNDDISAIKKKTVTLNTESNANGDPVLQGRVAGLQVSNATMDEVVVTGYGVERRSSITGSSAKISAREIGYYSSITQALQGKIAGVYVSNTEAGARILIRGMTSINGDNQPLVVVDGVPVETWTLNDMNTADISQITVLKDASATAIYGSRGANGVIVITSKSGKTVGDVYARWLRYKLRNQEDVAYMQEIKQVRREDKYERYLELRNEEERNAGFYFDMAQHLFEQGYTDEAVQVLSNAAEAAQGDLTTQRATAFVLQSWKAFDEAVNIYHELLMQQQYRYNTDIVRDLAWTYYEAGNYQEAVNTLYAAITKEQTNNNYYYYYNDDQRATLLEDMNAIIGMHKDVLDVSGIPAALIRPLPVDLKILVQSNTWQMGNVQITEPDGTLCEWSKPITKNGGILNNGYYHYYGTRDYSIRKAITGTYKITAGHYDRGPGGKIPSFIRIITFRNFGRKDQRIKIENIIMDNQVGDVEIAEVEVK